MTSIAFYNSNFFCIYIRGLPDESLQAKFNLPGWFIASLPWLVVLLAGMAIGINIVFKPETTDTKMSKAYITDELTKMSLMDRNGKLSLGVLIVCILLWAT